MNNWTDWSGGRRPVPDNTIVVTQRRNGETDEPRPAGLVWWPHYEENPYDIVRYRLLSKSDEYEADMVVAYRAEDGALFEDREQRDYYNKELINE